MINCYYIISARRRVQWAIQRVVGVSLRDTLAGTCTLRLPATKDRTDRSAHNCIRYLGVLLRRGEAAGIPPLPIELGEEFSRFNENFWPNAANRRISVLSWKKQHIGKNS